MPNLVVDFDTLLTMSGKDLGTTDYREITQQQINLFADATDDQQWIHVDPERAKDGPFGAPIAHGFLTLSLIIPFWGELFDVDGVTTKVNYGLDKVRFTSPVKVGSKVRMQGSIAEVTEVKSGAQIKVNATIEIEGQERPAVVAEFLARFYK
ncbi:MaoC family dehydratase [Arthrobacter sp. StoSoilB3]|uniref:MaoC family dehydratase n=1 Tax=Paenarthrobacter nicotinovorans TaxID=29320 RepID=UPI0009A9103B|nr:MaoC family dehydratase [Paenarthrobacter nicotinovorans]SKC05661.1 Acyl dehydratase [Arthrobacter sp. 31Cvi3.1E]BCW39352.1 MaoC family dehydratase [Arthrobacter sp. StoSoilB3]MBP2393713.1 acyl dehydratase [Paenarthrobacter nicotinovorans]UKF00041.1 MaoC family dehydratase [Paenarthrobacter nicotinovorans]UKF04823.1 MaoC family dehydratase [Paenarthrobacter nicotinovorans]